MKPFALDTVLSYRQQLEDRARQKLFAAQRQEAALQESLQEHTAQLTALYQDLEQERRQGVLPQRLILYEEAISQVQERIDRLQQELAEIRQTLSQRQRQLLKKSQDRRVLEKLRQKQNSDYQRYLAGKEAAMLDELAILFHDR